MSRPCCGGIRASATPPSWSGTTRRDGPGWWRTASCAGRSGRRTSTPARSCRRTWCPRRSSMMDAAAPHPERQARPARAARAGARASRRDRPSAPPRDEADERARRRSGARCSGWTEVGIDDDFFALGGDSFSAMRLARQIGDGLRVAAIFQHPTIRELADLLKGSNPRRTGSWYGCRLRRRPRRGRRRPPWSRCPSAAGTRPPTANSPAPCRPSSRCYAVDLPGHDFGDPVGPDGAARHAGGPVRRRDPRYRPGPRHRVRPLPRRRAGLRHRPASGGRRRGRRRRGVRGRVPGAAPAGTALRPVGQAPAQRPLAIRPPLSRHAARHRRAHRQPGPGRAGVHPACPQARLPAGRELYTGSATRQTVPARCTR